MQNSHLLKLLISLFSILVFVNAANAESNDPVQLNIHRNVERFQIDPNNDYVVFNEFDFSNGLQRYTTKIDGQSSPIQTGSNVNETTNGLQFFISQNNSRITSRLDNPITGGRDFLSVSINGDESTLLSPALPIIGDVSSNSSRSGDNILAFIINGGGLFSVPNDGSAPAINLSDAIDSTGNVDVGRIRRTQDGSSVVFDAELDAVSQQALFSVPIDGSSSPTRLTPLNETVVRNFVISDDQSSVVYAEENGPGFDILEQQLFIVPTDGSSDPIALTGLIDGFGFSQIDFTVSPDGSHVVYSLPNFSSGVTQLFSVATDGQTDPVLVDEGLEVHQVEITNDNQQIIYSITRSFSVNFLSGMSEITAIYSSALLPSNIDEPYLLSSTSTDTFVNDGVLDSFIPAPVNTDVDFVITQNNSFVFFIQSQSGSFTSSGDVDRILRSALNGSPELLLISETSLFPGVDPSTNFDFAQALDFKLSNDETFIIYISNTISNQTLQPQLAKVSLDGSNNQLLPTSNFGNVLDFDISNDGEFVVFTTGSELQQNLFSLSLANEEPLCFPIKAQNGNFVSICL